MYKQINQPKNGWLPGCLKVDFCVLTFAWFIHYSASEVALCLGWHGKLEYRVIVCSQNESFFKVTIQQPRGICRNSVLLTVVCLCPLSLRLRAGLVLSSMSYSAQVGGRMLNIGYMVCNWRIDLQTNKSQDDNLGEQVDRTLKCQKVSWAWVDDNRPTVRDDKAIVLQPSAYFGILWMAVMDK